MRCATFPDPCTTTRTSEGSSTTYYGSFSSYPSAYALKEARLLAQARHACAPAWQHGLDREPLPALMNPPPSSEPAFALRPFTPRRLAPREWSGFNFKKEKK